MLSTELMSLFRSEMADELEPYLWSDLEFYRYLDDAQKMFCRLTDGISDATTAAVCSITVPEGTEWIDLHPSILKIRTVTLVSNGKDVPVYNFEDLPNLGLRLDGSTGPLRALIVGMEENKARAAQIVSVDDALKLLVFRLPLADLTGANNETPEIGSQHHMHLLHWAKRCAYLKQDTQTLDKTKAADFEAMFRGYCKQVQKEQENKRHKVRTVRYGGIYGGEGLGQLGLYGGYNGYRRGGY